jgi:hypothetical protein
VVKRVIGLPNEHILIVDGHLIVDGRPLHEPYARRSVFNGQFSPPEGTYLLLGDNRDMSTDSSVAKVSIVGAGIQNAPGYAARMFGTMADAGINIEMISTSEIRITCMIAEDQVETAVRALHDAFELERPEAVVDEAAVGGAAAGTGR